MTPGSKERLLSRKRRGFRGFTIVETVISLLIVSLMFLSAMSSVAASGRSQLVAAHRAQGQALAASLMAEILSLPYTEPGGGGVFGRESGESSSSRAAWDDVDDYTGWTSSPPQDKAGAAIPGLTGWTSAVTVNWVNPTDFTAVVGTDQGVKRIVVTVSFGSTVVSVLTAVRTNAWQASGAA